MNRPHLNGSQAERFWIHYESIQFQSINNYQQDFFFFFLHISKMSLNGLEGDISGLIRNNLIKK